MAVPPRGFRLTTIGGLAAVLLLLCAPAAGARPPVLQTVGAEGGHATAAWSKEPGVKMRFIEIATKPDVTSHGYFDGNVFSFDVLSENQTSFKDACQRCVLQPGTKYYVHVAGQDSPNLKTCPPREFSDRLSLVLNADGTTTVEDIGGGHPPCPRGQGGGGGGTLPPPATGPGPDRTAPFQVLTARRSQDVDKLFVTVRANEDVTVTARASVNVPGASKVHRFRSVTRSVEARKKAKLRLKLARKSLREVKRALGRGKRLSARITVTAVDRAGNKRVDRLRVRLRR